MRSSTLIPCAACLLLAAAPCFAADPDTTTRHTLQSTVLAEARTLDVTLPTGYRTNASARYPVVFVLDGEFEGKVAAAIANFYSDVASIPEVIVVAVHNTQRTRDLTPEPVAPFDAPPGPAGGADKFLAFLQQEAIPFIDKSYRTAPMRVLIGHSLGGLFALHVLARQPALFTGYIVMEPSVWWNRQQPLRDARSVLQTPAARRARVMAVNMAPLSSDTVHWGGERSMVREIHVAGETHASMAAIGIATGLRRLFEDFRPAEWQPGLAPLAMLTRYDSLAARVGYEVPIPEDAYARAARMSLDARLFDDAQTALDRLDRKFPQSEEGRMLRARLHEERSQPAPASFIPLVFPAQRPGPLQAKRFLGRWQSTDAGTRHEIEVRAAGDTIIVHDRFDIPNGGPPYDADDPVIQLTENGTLEWGLRQFMGLAALVVCKATLIDDDTMEVRRESRGWVPRDPDFNAGGVLRFKRVRS
ncbi:MAG TPA: alpha/beta hydrolase-fold protein [Longimicrobiales bacterium]